jgi:hypothetical protein
MRACISAVPTHVTLPTSLLQEALVQLLVRVRTFRCDTTDCPRRVFAERLTPFIDPWARMTRRLSQTNEAIGLATSGELGARFAPRLGGATSPTTILRRTMTLAPGPSEPVSQVGIDARELPSGPPLRNHSRQCSHSSAHRSLARPRDRNRPSVDRDPIHLEKKEQQALAAICQASPTAQAVYE